MGTRRPGAAAPPSPKSPTTQGFWSPREARAEAAEAQGWALLLHLRIDPLGQGWAPGEEGQALGQTCLPGKSCPFSVLGGLHLTMSLGPRAGPIGRCPRGWSSGCRPRGLSTSGRHSQQPPTPPWVWSRSRLVAPALFLACCQEGTRVAPSHLRPPLPTAPPHLPPQSPISCPALTPSSSPALGGLGRLWAWSRTHRSSLSREPLGSLQNNVAPALVLWPVLDFSPLFSLQANLEANWALRSADVSAVALRLASWVRPQLSWHGETALFRFGIVCGS